MGGTQYGGRGIKVCERWGDFRLFLADMGEPGEGLSIDRIDNEGDYEPGNCRWATVLEQSRNRRSSLTWTCNGVTKSVIEWAELFGIKYKTLYARIKYYGGSDRKILTGQD